MRVYCLDRQESFYDTKILQRMIEPVFIPTATTLERIDSPLLLYGNWYQDKFTEGLIWLSSIAYQLRYPCIVLPPYKLGSISESLGIQVGLRVIGLDTNNLKTEQNNLSLDRPQLRVQADYGFIGPAGNSLVKTNNGETVVAVLRPRSSSTPLILCGLRILSTSGLSDALDRQLLLQALINWSMQNHSDIGDEQDFPLETSLETSPDILKSIAVLIAVESQTDKDNLIALAKSTFGINLSDKELDYAVNEFQENGLIELNDEHILSPTSDLENYVQRLGLWPYLRMLREDINTRN